MAYDVILTTAYFPPIQYFAEIINSDKVFIETNENYSRQSYRNRCNILSCNGILPLTIPIVRNNNENNNICNIKIDYSTNWQRLHLNAIVSAYGKSPFFSYYSDKLLDTIKQNKELLIDLNSNILKVILEILKVKKEIKNTDHFVKEYSDDIIDLRYSIHPKVIIKSNSEFYNKEYIQTFCDRFKFIPNLSILDLIFNLGPESLNFLTIKKPSN
ncbi:MAG: WbqC family protein [Bacteroidia bacterium]|nr:WbqC family protein [Bacteroidia bacterium]